MCLILTMHNTCFNSLMPSDAYMSPQTKHHWFRQWLVAWPAPSHYLNQYWNIVNWTLENGDQNVVLKMVAIMSRPQCVKKTKSPLLVSMWDVPICNVVMKLLNRSCSTGMPLLGWLSWYPLTLSCPCISLERRAPVDGIQECHTFKWVPVTWFENRET